MSSQTFPAATGQPQAWGREGGSVFRLLWYAAYTRPHHERVVSASLHQRGYEVLYPRFLTRRRWTDRVKETELPLFPGYVFVRCDPSHRLPVMQTPGLLHLVSDSAGPVAVPDIEVENLRQAMQAGVSLLPVPHLKVGDQVSICQGPLRGVRGILSKFRNAQWVVVSVELLARSVAVEVSPAWLTVESS